MDLGPLSSTEPSWHGGALLCIPTPEMYLKAMLEEYWWSG